MKTFHISILALALMLSAAGTPAARLVITGCTVVDGSGRGGFEADVAIEDGVIVAIGEISRRPDDTVISAAGKILSPGFIDLHNHSAQGLLESADAASQVSQGITTIVIGPDGGSPYPVNAYLKRLEEKKTAVNVALMVGHGTVRRMILGEDYKRPASAQEVEAMAALVRLAMQQGAFGLSSGLEYDPGFYSDISELIALAREAARAGGFYMSHIRDEEEGFAEALKEAVEIGRQARLPVQISHLKLGNRRVWGRTAEALEILHGAVRQGIDVTADCYPYDAWASGIAILVPSRRFEDRAEIADAFDKVGGAQNVLVTRYQPDPSFEFKTMEELAQQRNTTPIDLFIEIVKNGGAGIVCRSMNEEDVHAFYRDPLVMVASDGGIDSRHPRKAGTFTRVLGRLVREQVILPLEEAIHKMTGLPARRLGLADRGLVKEGFRADLVIFDPAKVIDRAGFQQPDLLSEGIELTLVNGVPVWKEGSVTGSLPGTVLVRTAR